MIRIPWRAWYGDEWLEIRTPASWQVQAYWPADGPDIGPEGIETAFDQAIGTQPIEELACGKRTVAIAVDDISRPCPAARLMPLLMKKLETAGVDLDDVKVILGIGTHAPMHKAAIVKKLGREAAERLDVHNSSPYGNTVELGTSRRGTPVRINRFYAEAELKLGVGSITPHGGPGFGGGAKVIIPGVASIETVSSMHEPGRLKTGLIDVENNELRDEIEHMVRDHVGLDFVANVVVNSRREIAGLFVGDMVAAHRAGVAHAKQVYATEIPSEPVDIVITNAYPKDTDFLQAGMGLNVLVSSPRPVVKPQGTVVLVSANPEGRGYHGLYGPGMMYDRALGHPGERHDRAFRGTPLVYYAPDITPADARCNALYREWDALIAHLQERHGDQATVAVFPCGAIQLAAESVAN
jgi:nickel-dependent lactate racemase